jgi:ribulose-5-phosphate 4-epimerase/fuculose-1-phosphate aldolase
MAYRLADHYRWTDQIYPHFTAKVPGTEHFLINPFGVLFDEVTASCLVKVDLEGKVILDPSGIGCNAAGFLIHSCVHRARPELSCVLHTHTACGVGVAAQKRGLLMISQHAMRAFTSASATTTTRALPWTSASRSVWCAIWGPTR